MTVGEPLPYGHTLKSRPWRTGLLATTLVERGHAVTWWTSSVDHFTKTSFVDAPLATRAASGVVLQFLHGRPYKKNVSLARLRNHREIAQQFAEIAPTLATPDLIVCSYPTIELSAQAVRYGSRRSVPVVLDIRDLWPDEMVARLPAVLRPLSAVLFGRMYREARYALTGAAGLMAVSQAYLDWGLRYARRSVTANDAVLTHGYPAPSGEKPPSDVASRWLSEKGIDASKKIFWFVGTFVGSIDLATVIDAARRMIDQPDVLFVLSGAGERDAEWRGRAAGLKNVVFTGWCDPEELAVVASVAYAGLGAWRREALVSLTNKFFEYMAHGLPILLSLGGEARSIVEQTGCGLAYEPGSPDSLESAIRRISGDKELRDRMAESARRAFAERYSAAQIYRQMADHLESFANGA
jgi:glycosyltransferase involved in cell wall biosynthesis